MIEDVLTLFEGYEVMYTDLQNNMERQVKKLGDQLIAEIQKRGWPSWSGHTLENLKNVSHGGTISIEVPFPGSYRITGFPQTNDVMPFALGSVLPIHGRDGEVFIRTVTAASIESGAWRYPKGENFVQDVMKSLDFRIHIDDTAKELNLEFSVQQQREFEKADRVRARTVSPPPPPPPSLPSKIRSGRRPTLTESLKGTIQTSREFAKERGIKTTKPPKQKKTLGSYYNSEFDLGSAFRTRRRDGE